MNDHDIEKIVGTLQQHSDAIEELLGSERGRIALERYVRQELTLLGFLLKYEEGDTEERWEWPYAEEEELRDPRLQEKRERYEERRRRDERQGAEEETPQGWRRRAKDWLREHGPGIAKTLLEKINSIISGGLSGRG